MLPMVEISTLLFTWNDFVPEENICVDLFNMEVQEFELLGERKELVYSPSDITISNIIKSID